MKRYCFNVESVQLVILVTTAQKYVIHHTMAVAVLRNANAHHAIVSTVVFLLPLNM